MWNKLFPAALVRLDGLEKDVLALPKRGVQKAVTADTPAPEAEAPFLDN